jgi:uncharacterized protein
MAERGDAQQATEALMRSLFRAALLCCAVVATGCATYSDHMLAAHEAAARTDWPAAEDEINAILGVDSRADLPETWSSEESLGVLERAAVLQAQGAWRESARDLSAAESELELIDFSVDAVGTIGTYIYSDSAGKYRTPPLERIALNVFNMANYLAMADLDGAAVEARRYQVMREYLENMGIEHPPGTIGAYLAGFTFERLGEAARALRYYQDGQTAVKLRSLEEPVARKGKRPESGEVLVVIGAGRTPIKVPKRIPIGAAIGIAGSAISGDLRVLQHSVFKVVVYPELEEVPSQVRGARVRIGGRDAEVELVTDVAAEVAREYDKMRPRIIAAALTRMIARAAVSEGAMAAGRGAGGAGEVVGIVAGLGAEAALVALDKPDTRSWTFLPGRVWIARMTVAAGAHEVVVEFEGDGVPERRVPIAVAAGGYAAVVVTEPR